MAMVKMCSTWPLMNKCVLLKDFEVGLQTPRPPQTSYIAYGKGQKLKIWILFLFLLCSKWIHSNLKWIIIMFKQELNMIYRTHGHVLTMFKSQMAVLVKNGNFVTFGCCGNVKPFKFSIKCPYCSFYFN